ncbi:hypothetical protein UQW22_09895 [Isoptericola halotolerans]|uniref:hypothetical protein n=1 Tax=Isoptericola halotolerans TaxID=300560 RepID=UPI00388D717B
MTDQWADVHAMIQDAADAALRVEAEIALDRTRDLAPKDSRELVESLTVEGDGTTLSLTTDAEHAVYQHEALDLQHPNGGQAKFMEAAVLGRTNYDQLGRAAARAAAAKFG